MGEKPDSPKRSQALNVNAKWAIFGKQNWRCGMIANKYREGKLKSTLKRE